MRLGLVGYGVGGRFFHAPFVAAAGVPATLVVDAESGLRPAWNLVARLDRGAARTLIVTTPRSGWFTCAAERGSGVAAWMSLARWLAAAKPATRIWSSLTSAPVIPCRNVRVQP